MKREDIPDDQLFDGYGGQIAQVARTLVQRRSDWLERLLEVLPVGGVLCVHELPIGFDDLHAVASRAEAHVLGLDGCDAEMAKVQYGPKPVELGNWMGES